MGSSGHRKRENKISTHLWGTAGVTRFRSLKVLSLTGERIQR
jgi:hypothetical protein